MPPIQKVLDEFVASFNDNNLDRTMEFFADDATVHRGLPAIRAAFEPQFAGAFGAMRFDVEDQLVDEPGRKAALRWICRHDVAGGHGRSVSWWLRLLMRLRFRSRAGWRGVD